MIVVDRFDPADDDSRFIGCCGAYRRWERVARHDRLWWQLASDWGQGTVRGLVLPVGAFRLEIEIDLTELPSGGLYVALCSRLRVGRTGVDGLQFFTDMALSVGVEQRALRVRTTGDEFLHPFPPDALAHEPVILVFDADGERITVRLGDMMETCADFRSTRPLAVLLGGNTGAEDPRGRFGVIVLKAPGRAAMHST
jgi:hypothetical protein